ncbi:DUF4123 domain-containing protein [Pseudomonas sp. NPDC098747]|uniref:DUF4123 domain-containing protein n=1 Tax=Pseudomonas sp. NPDC098747 TaxID=3364487 RepID=UPI00383BDA90
MITTIASPFQLPAAPGALCLILDASFDAQLQTYLEDAAGTSGALCVPLLESTPYAGVQDVGPFALLCPSTNELTAYASALLERADAGCVAYVQNPRHFDLAIEHWRSLLTVRTDESTEQMMRFFDPRWLEPLLNSLNDNELTEVMGPVTDFAWRNELGWRHRPPAPCIWEGEVQAPGWFDLTPARETAMNHQRLQVLAGRFAQDYSHALPIPAPANFVYDQLLAAHHSGFTQTPDQERWLRLSLRLGEGFWSRSPHGEVLARPSLSLSDKLVELERL